MEIDSCTHSLYVECGREFRILSQHNDTGVFEISASGVCFNASFAALEASPAGRWLLVKYRWLYLKHLFGWLLHDLRREKAVEKLTLREESICRGRVYVVVGSCCAHPTSIPEEEVTASISGWLFLPQNEGKEFLTVIILYIWHKLLEVR